MSKEHGDGGSGGRMEGGETEGKGRADSVSNMDPLQLVEMQKQQH